MTVTVSEEPGASSGVPSSRTAPRAAGRRERTRHLLVAVVGLVAGALAAWVTHRGLIDDTYITLSYARTLVEHHSWGLTPYEQSNSATSPLNVLLLAGCLLVVSAVSSSATAVGALALLTTLLGGALGFSASRAASALRLPWPWAVVVVAVVLANPFVLSALGLEVVLLATVLVGLLAAALRGRAVAFGVLSGAAMLARLDLVLFVLLLAVCSPLLRPRLPLAALCAVVVALPWFAYSWWHLGSAIPDTFVIKTLQKSFGDATYLNGLWVTYAPRNLAAVLVSAAPAAVGVVVLAALLVTVLVARRRRGAPGRWRGAGPLVALGAGGVAYYAVYTVMGVPPYQWYYVAPMVSLGVVAVLGAGLLGAGLLRRPASPRTAGLTKVLTAVLPTAVLCAGLLASTAGRPLPWSTPPVFGNFVTPARYLQVGSELGPVVGTRGVASPGEIGTLAYSCRCAVVDAFSGQGEVVPLIRERRAKAGPLMRALLDLNYQHLDRSVRPYPLRYALQWVPAGDPLAGDPRAVRSWAVDGPALGPGRLVLLDR